MKRLAIIAVLVFTSTCVFSQSRYIPLGVNGTLFSLSSRVSSEGHSCTVLEAGYSIGGRMDLSFKVGALVEEVDGYNAILPVLSFNFDVVMLKQKEAFPLSLKASIGKGFGSGISEYRTIFGTDYRFALLLSHDLSLEKMFLGFNGTVEYCRVKYEVSDPPGSDPPLTIRSHDILYGAGFDIGWKYRHNGLLVVRADFLLDEDFRFHGRLALSIVVSTFR